MKHQPGRRFNSRGYKLFFRLAVFLFLASLAATAAYAQTAPDPRTSEEIELSADTASAGIAWGDPNGPHSTYTWPFTVVQMGHAIQSYQEYGGTPYFHHGIDMIAPDGTDVFTRSGGQVVNVENYTVGNDLYWEVAILDSEGYVWQYHHINKNTIPQSIKDKFNEWKANPTTGGYIPPNTYIGDIVYWTVTSFGYRFNHIHLNILADGDAYLNTMEFHSPSLTDTVFPEIQQIGLLKDNKMVAGNTISGSYGMYVRARDLMLSTVYYLPPYRVDFSIDGGPATTVWEFHDLPGGADDTQYATDYYVVTPTCGNYDCRDFVIDLGFTKSGQRAFPSTPGLHNIVVRAWDNSGNSVTKTFWWTVYNSYENTTTTSIPDNGCASNNSAVKTFNVTEALTVTDINLGLNLTHATRGQIQVTLKAPGDATATTVIPAASDSYDNYDVLVDDSSTNSVNDNSNDTVASPYYEAERTAGPRTDGSLDAFNGKSAQGTWTLAICDNTSSTTGSVNRVRLDISGQPLSQSAIGNLVWLDQDGDGLYDAGEAGLPNVKVDLCANSACSTVLRSTYTDATGGYLFSKTTSSVAPAAGTYYVRTTPPAGLSQTYDENGSLDNQSQVVLSAGQQYLSADFGYNWSNSVTPKEPTAGSGAIGDRVWADANNDGVQQGSEIGLAGVTVDLMTAGNDGLFNTGDDLVATTTSTNHTGNYLFSNLPSGAYMVRLSNLPAGYTQTGDPDQYGTACSACDNQTTIPIVLSPGDIFVNADFGYKPGGSAGGSIGDTLWLDSDRGNDIDAGELRLAGVTVALIKDLDGDSAWDAGEPIIASDITDSSGAYGFASLPANGSEDYLVWVNDTFNQIGELAASYDARDGASQANPAGGLVTGLGISAVTNLTATTVTDSDFAFIQPWQDPIGGATGVATTLEGLIGDTIWLDTNNNGAFNPGEGMEGVSVRLYASGGTNLLASAITNENGQYFFGGVNPASSYVVQVQTATLPYTGLTNFVDPDGGTASSANITLTAGAPVNLAQDFGYRDASSPNTISGTLWIDLDGDGALDAVETTGFQGVTLALYSNSGKIVSLTTTDASGSYIFSNLPDGIFRVTVTDDNHILNGYWKSNGANPNSNNNSQVDPYQVTVSGGQTDATGDFGYYLRLDALGNFVWDDLNHDGIQNDGETGMNGVVMTLEISYPTGATMTLKAATANDANGKAGFYRFANLLLDEDFNGDGASPEPSFSLKVDPSQPALSGYAATLSGAAGSTQYNDANNPGGTPVQPILGLVDVSRAKDGVLQASYDFGFAQSGAIGDFVWFDADRDGVQDGTEAGIAGVTLELQDSSGNPIDADPLTTGIQPMRTTTDANGGYLFAALPAGSYRVDVISGVPSGLALTTGSGDPSGVIVLLNGDAYNQADFGYKTANSVTIGDTIWYDADGDGIQGPDEAGIGGIRVSISLTYRIISGAIDTNADNLIDTNDDGALQGFMVIDGKLDLSGDGAIGPEDDGSFAGFPVIDGNLDVDHNGAIDILDNANLKALVATPTTTSDGNYLVTGLQGGLSAEVAVITSDIAAKGYSVTPTNGPATRSYGLARNFDILYADFGFNGGATGAIGDILYLDKDRDGVQDAGEPGIPGVTIDLYTDPNGDGNPLDGALATTLTTEANGSYLFTGLASGSYVVVVNDVNNVLSGLSQSGDPDLPGAPCSLCDGKASAVISGGVGQTGIDFGYAPALGSIGNLVWHDLNGDGDRDSGEPGLPAVTLDLWLDANVNGGIDVGIDTLARQITTNETGNYEFTLLPPGTYLVDVTDVTGVLGGFSRTAGSPNSDDNSQGEPYRVTLTGAVLNSFVADFGYSAQTPHTIHGSAFQDRNGNGNWENTTEPNLSNVLVTLYKDLNSDGTIDPGEPVIGMDTSDANGYQFTNLPDGKYVAATNASNTEADGWIQTTQVNTQAVQPVTLVGADSNNNNFGYGAYNPSPTAVTMASFTATMQGADIVVGWETLLEINTLGYNIYRSSGITGADRQLLNLTLIPSQFDNADGAAYTFIDSAAQEGIVYYYWLEVISNDGQREIYGPQIAVRWSTFGPKIFLPIAVH